VAAASAWATSGRSSPPSSPAAEALLGHRAINQRLGWSGGKCASRASWKSSLGQAPRSTRCYMPSSPWVWRAPSTRADHSSWKLAGHGGVRLLSLKSARCWGAAGRRCVRCCVSAHWHIPAQPNQAQPNQACPSPSLRSPLKHGRGSSARLRCKPSSARAFLCTSCCPLPRPARLQLVGGRSWTRPPPSPSSAATCLAAPVAAPLPPPPPGPPPPVMARPRTCTAPGTASSWVSRVAPPARVPTALVDRVAIVDAAGRSQRSSPTPRPCCHRTLQPGKSTPAQPPRSLSPGPGSKRDLSSTSIRGSRWARGERPSPPAAASPGACC
jgi:hypothetical protein